jgi:hypothetical protein
LEKKADKSEIFFENRRAWGFRAAKGNAGRRFVQGMVEGSPSFLGIGFTRATTLGFSDTTSE